ncbi:MAG TPA: hypothetical protein VGN23_16235 [Verrucomicrobiae bacterium]|jgi:hypothetical protein
MAVKIDVWNARAKLDGLSYYGVSEFRLDVFFAVAHLLRISRTFMKHYYLLVLAILLVAISDMRGQESRSPGDKELQRKLTGTWVTAWGNNMITTNVIAADGSYVSQITGPNGGRARYEGTFLVTNGIVYGKAIFEKQPVTMRLHIIQLDSHELIWSNDVMATPITFHKVGK